MRSNQPIHLVDLHNQRVQAPFLALARGESRARERSLEIARQIPSRAVVRVCVSAWSLECAWASGPQAPHGRGLLKRSRTSKASRVAQQFVSPAAALVEALCGRRLSESGAPSLVQSHICDAAALSPLAPRSETYWLSLEGMACWHFNLLLALLADTCRCSSASAANGPPLAPPALRRGSLLCAARWLGFRGSRSYPHAGFLFPRRLCVLLLSIAVLSTAETLPITRLLQVSTGEFGDFSEIPCSSRSSFWQDVSAVVDDPYIRQYARATSLSVDDCQSLKEIRELSVEYLFSAFERSREDGFGFRIHEQWLNSSNSQGGSSFFIRIRDPLSTSVCKYEDHFNGTYTVLCPKAVAAVTMYHLDVRLE